MCYRSKTTPSFLTVKEGDFSTSPSLLQGELHLSHQASLPSGTRGCSWLRYSLRQSFVIGSGACARKGLPIIIYATKLRLCVGWRIESITGNSTLIRFYYCSLGEGCKMHSILFFSPLFLFLIAVSLCTCRRSNEEYNFINLCLTYR